MSFFFKDFFFSQCLRNGFICNLKCTTPFILDVVKGDTLVQGDFRKTKWNELDKHLASRLRIDLDQLPIFKRRKLLHDINMK
jgi:hypothetical protein